MSWRHADIWSHPVTIWQIFTPDLGHQMDMVSSLSTSTPFVQCQSALPFWDNSYPWSRSYVWSKSRSHITLKIQRSRSWPWSNMVKYDVTFEASSSIDKFAFRFVAIGALFLQRYCKFFIWPWKFNVNVRAKVKPNVHIWGLEINRYICFSFRGNRTILRYSKLHIWPWTFKVKVMAKVKPDGHLKPRFQLIYLLFVPWKSDHFWLRYSKLHIWPWKFKVKVTTKSRQYLIR